MTTLTETCACGATFTTTASTSAAVDYSAAKWREGHKHVEGVGICGDAPEVAGFPDHLPRPICHLKAGHAGMHGDGEGAHWTRTPEFGPERRQGAPDAPSPGTSSTGVISGPQIGAQRFEGEA